LTVRQWPRAPSLARSSATQAGITSDQRPSVAANPPDGRQISRRRTTTIRYRRGRVPGSVLRLRGKGHGAMTHTGRDIALAAATSAPPKITAATKRETTRWARASTFSRSSPHPGAGSPRSASRLSAASCTSPRHRCLPSTA
jgi:hypothetical protein